MFPEAFHDAVYYSSNAHMVAHHDSLVAQLRETRKQHLRALWEWTVRRANETHAERRQVAFNLGRELARRAGDGSADDQARRRRSREGMSGEGVSQIHVMAQARGESRASRDRSGSASKSRTGTDQGTPLSPIERWRISQHGRWSARSRGSR